MTGNAGAIGRLDYPDWHIEISSHLTIMIPLLRKRYPAAKWVHLFRRRDDCIDSLARLEAAMKAFAVVFFQCREPDLRQTASVVYDTFNALCRQLMPADNTFSLPLERAYELWPECWAFMGCRGPLAASRREWLVHYNAS